MAALSQFNYQILGHPSGQKLVFLHGLLGSGANWRRITPSFQDRFHILIYDQRGHGRSFKPSHGYTPEDYAKDLHSILNELEWKKIHLVGHSMGGRNALEFASLYPESVETLVIEDISVEATQKTQKSILKLLDLVPVPFENRQEVREFFNEEYPKRIAYAQNPVALSQYFYSNIAETEDGKMDWRFSLDGVKQSLAEGAKVSRWDLISKLKVPTLYIRGERSTDLSREDFEKTLAMNSKIEGHEIKDAGHWVHSDQPEEFIRVLNEFLTLHG